LLEFAMTKKWWLVVGLLIALTLFAGCSSFPKVADISPCCTAEEAKQRGTWVCNLAVTPARVTWQGHDIAFKEAWVEEAAAPDHFLVWPQYYRRIGWKYLCFTLAEGQELFSNPASPHFRLEGEQSGFAIDLTGGRQTYFHWSDDSFSFPMNMGIAPDSQTPVDAYDITLTAMPKAGRFR
jgi:hypothetical protein